MMYNKLKLTRDDTKLLILSACHWPCPSADYIYVFCEEIEPRNTGVTFDQDIS